MMVKNTKFLIIFVVVLAIGFFVWRQQENSKIQSVNSFEECVQAGFLVMESYPEQCRTPDGRGFTRKVGDLSDVQTETVEEIGLTFTYPSDLIYRKEIAEDGNAIRTAGFFLTKGSEDNPEYQLYGLHEQYRDATVADLERAKTEMDPTTIKETTIAGYPGIEGLIIGPKTRYITIILKDGKLFSVSTMPPTQENKAVTEQILATFSFK